MLGNLTQLGGVQAFQLLYLLLPQTLFSFKHLRMRGGEDRVKPQRRSRRMYKLRAKNTSHGIHLSDGALTLIQVSPHLFQLMFFLHQALLQIPDLERDHMKDLPVYKSSRPAQPPSLQCCAYHFLNRKGECPFIRRRSLPSVWSQAAQGRHAPTRHLSYGHAPWPHSLLGQRGAVQGADGVDLAHGCAWVHKEMKNINTHTFIKCQKINNAYQRVL